MDGRLTGIVFSLNPNIGSRITGWECENYVYADSRCFEPVLHDVSSLGIYTPGKADFLCQDVAERAQQLGIKSGLLHAETMRFQRQRFLPEWEPYEFLLFPEIWRRQDGVRRMFVIRLRGRNWGFSDVSLGYRISRGLIVGVHERNPAEEEWIPQQSQRVA